MYIAPLANLSRQTGVVQIRLHLFGYRQNVCKQKMSKDSSSRLLEFKNQYKSEDYTYVHEGPFPPGSN